jgi:hypothetical protein
MSKSQYYRDQETRCVELAHRSDLWDIKDDWASLAEQWRTLAEDAERQEARESG